MKIILVKISISNFKGFRFFETTFDPVVNYVFGANGTGKTTLSDAFMWDLFDKDSTDRKDFEIKPLDENNKPFHKLDHEVACTFLINGVEATLRKSLREKWTKPRGAKDQVFDGHETSYFWNDVPMKKNEYQAKVAELINETTFKMLSNPLYFNQQLKWQDRRAMLLQIAGDISDADILNSGTQYSNLLAMMAGVKTVEQVKKEITSKKKTIKDELILLPSRIDEAKRSLPDDIDYDGLQVTVQNIEKQLANIDAQLTDQSQAEKEYQQRIAGLLQNKQEHNRHLLDIEFTEKEKVRAAQQQRLSAINGVKTEASSITHEITSLQAAIQRLESDKARLLNEQTDLRAKWTAIGNEQLVFDDNDFCCPTCSRAFEDTDVQAKKLEMINSFNKNKSERLEANVARGKAIGLEIKDLENSIHSKQTELDYNKNRLSVCERSIATLEEENVRLTTNEAGEVTKALAAHSIYQKTKADILFIDQEVAAPRSDNGKAVLLEEKSKLQSQLNENNGLLNTKAQKEKTEARIVELQNQESEMAQSLADLEGIEYSIEQFTAAKMDMLEQRVNGLFQLVRFKMFEDQINGGKEETCVALINGVPFSDANTASKINAGVDIINVLSRHFNVSAPIFIDNRESVVNLIDTDSQVINLVVSAPDKKLRLSTTSAATAPVSAKTQAKELA